jgi:hypothetical protein
VIEVYQEIRDVRPIGQRVLGEDRCCMDREMQIERGSKLVVEVNDIRIWLVKLTFSA